MVELLAFRPPESRAVMMEMSTDPDTRASGMRTIALGLGAGHVQRWSWPQASPASKPHPSRFRCQKKLEVANASALAGDTSVVDAAHRRLLDVSAQRVGVSSALAIRNGRLLVNSRLSICRQSRRSRTDCGIASAQEGTRTSAARAWDGWWWR